MGKTRHRTGAGDQKRRMRRTAWSILVENIEYIYPSHQITFPQPLPQFAIGHFLKWPTPYRKAPNTLPSALRCSVVFWDATTKPQCGLTSISLEHKFTPFPLPRSDRQARSASSILMPVAHTLTSFRHQNAKSRNLKPASLNLQHQVAGLQCR